MFFGGALVVDWFEQSGLLIVSVVPRLALWYFLETRLAYPAGAHDLRHWTRWKTGSYPILFFRPNFGVFRRKTMLSLSQISKYPFQEFWCVVFQELEKALDRVLFVESVKDTVNNDEAPMLIRQRMNQRIDDRILFVPAVETLAFLSGSFLHIVSLGNEKTN